MVNDQWHKRQFAKMVDEFAKASGRGKDECEATLSGIFSAMKMFTDMLNTAPSNYHLDVMQMAIYVYANGYLPLTFAEKGREMMDALVKHFQRDFVTMCEDGAVPQPGVAGNN